ncbi:MAG: ABC transporter ATP-binding protein [Rhodospirillales bacterium]|nr:ABC transporter ATP-binding protein [Rhodospirillales bacterium]
MRIHIRSKRFPAVGDAGEKLVLENVAFEPQPGEFVAIFGPSGCGKTTLLNIVAGLDLDFEVSVDLNGIGRDRPSPTARNEPAIGYVFQTPRLLPWKTVEDNLRLVLPSEHDADDRIEAVLRAVDLQDARHVYPNRLSVGMSRRAALARAFVVEPDLLILDEPFVSIDSATANRLRDLLSELLSRLPTTVLFVTHDLREAIALADRILFLSTHPAHITADITIEPPRPHRTTADIDAFHKKLQTKVASVFRTGDRSE